MPLSPLQTRVDRWISQFEEGYFHPLTNMARLAEEVGELARDINDRFGQKSRKPEEPEGDLAMEMADILFVIICMANREGIDLDDAFERMICGMRSDGRGRTRDTGRGTRSSCLASRVSPPAYSHSLGAPSNSRSST